MIRLFNVTHCGDSYILYGHSLWGLLYLIWTLIVGTLISYMDTHCGDSYILYGHSLSGLLYLIWTLIVGLLYLIWTLIVRTQISYMDTHCPDSYILYLIVETLISYILLWGLLYLISCGDSYISSKILSVYSIDPTDWAKKYYSSI